jgi:hypothetical protein
MTEENKKAEETKDTSYQETWGASPEKKQKLADKLPKKTEAPPKVEDKTGRAPAGDANRPNQTPQGPSQ